VINRTKTVFEESNVISLRTALVIDDGEHITLSLNPALTPQPTKNLYKVEFRDWLKTCFIYLYRHMRCPAEEEALIKNPYSVGRNVRPMAFEGRPHFKLLWTDSGNSVALYLNGEPWAFFEEQTCKGYTKGILNSADGNLWDQVLFEKTFDTK
jgi:hypothetical protein